MTRSRSPRAVLCEAYATAVRALPKYSHPCSPKKFTQHQLFACLVLKDFYNLPYRGVVAMLADCSDLRGAIDLERVPHFTTLEKAAHRLLITARFRRLIEATVERARAYWIVKPRPDLAAIDTSGFEALHTSRYYARRRKTSGLAGRKRKVVYRHFPKLGLVVDTQSHCILAARASRGPFPDFGDFEPLLREAARVALPKAVAADAGFDSEASHELARDELGVQSLINPTHGRPTDKEPTGRYRRQMKRHLHHSRYPQRWQVETVFSMIKRQSGEVVDAKTQRRRQRMLLLKTLTHNIAIL
jgi:hypothetical protein